MIAIFLFLSLQSGIALADQMITLYPGQCIGVNGRQLCWHYRPSIWDHPDLPPRSCDFDRTCPITYFVPDAYSTFGDFSTQVTNQNIFRYCKKIASEKGDKFSLVQVTVKNDGSKTETVLADYEDDRGKCEREEQAFRYPTSYRGYPAPTVDTYRTPPACPGTYYERKTLKDIGRDFQRLLGN